MTINDWVKRCHEIAVAHGWWDEEKSLGECIALMHSELSEALEEARAGRPGEYVLTAENDELYLEKDREKFAGRQPEGIYVELVDCVIRIFDYLGHEGADVEAIMTEKCAYNETRPYRHGKKF